MYFGVILQVKAWKGGMRTAAFTCSCRSISSKTLKNLEFVLFGTVSGLRTCKLAMFPLPKVMHTWGLCVTDWWFLNASQSI